MFGNTLFIFICGLVIGYYVGWFTKQEDSIKKAFKKIFKG
jgi:hypothetical protein